MRLLPISNVTEGQAAEVCVIMESQNSNELGLDVMVVLEVTDGTASVYYNTKLYFVLIIDLLLLICSKG